MKLSILCKHRRRFRNYYHRAAEVEVSTPKIEAAAMLKALPDDSSFEDIQYHLYVLEKVNRGIQRAEAEGVVSHEDAKVRLGKWLSA